MSRYDPAAHTMAHSGPLRWAAIPSRMGRDGSCEWVSGESVACHPGFSAAC